MSTEPKTGLTYWPAGSQQPDLLFNDLLLRFGSTGSQPTVIDKDLATPPGSPAAGDTYIVAGSPTGAWTGHAKDIAYYDTTWHFFTPSEGWRVDVLDEDLQYRYSGSAWAIASPGAYAPLDSPTFTGNHTVSQADFLTGVISPTALAANTNDWAPTGFSTCSVVRASCSAAVTLTGLAGGAAGRSIQVHNVGSFDLLITNEDTGSTGANRFAIRRSLILPPNKGVTFWYDGTSSRWRLSADQDRNVMVLLPSDVVNSDAVANTLADVTGLKFDVIAGKIYRFHFFVTYDAAAITTGSRWTLNGPGITSLDWKVIQTTDSTSTGVRNPAADSYAGGVVNTASIIAGNIAEITGHFVASANGSLQAQFASEVASSAITAKANISFVEYECMNA